MRDSDTDERREQANQSYYEKLGVNSLYKDFGPLISQALQNADITEIMRNNDGRLFFETKGEMVAVDRLPEEESNAIVRTLASLLHKNLDLKCPIISGEIPFQNARFEGVLPPLSNGAIFSIRRHQSIALSLEDLQKQDMLNRGAIEMLYRAIQEHKSILISGATGTGKTTLVNSLLLAVREMFPKERILTLEDTKELQVASSNHVNLFTSEHVDMGQLLKSALRLRPDRIVVGEVRGAEALDLLDAFSTGHSGGFTTIHAGSLEQALMRLVLLVSRHPSAPPQIEKLIANAINLVVQLDRYPYRHICAMGEVLDFDPARGFVIHNIYSDFKRHLFY